jgi:UTP--glucose-1-phosphate uridylyltransferase
VAGYFSPAATMKAKHALITAAGPDSRRLPMQNLNDRQGDWKAAMVIQLEELFAAGIEKTGVVVKPAERAAYEQLLAGFGGKVTLIEQADPSGYGHAVLCGKEFTAGKPFLLQVSDHLYVSEGEASCTRQLLDVAAEQDCSVSAVQATHESQLRYYGTVAGLLCPGRSGLYTVENVYEKPTPTLAEQSCVVPGLRSGFYLCFFGMHVLGPSIFTLLEEEAARSKDGKIGLTPALARLAAREKYLAAELNGRRADLEARFGVLRAQLALGLAGPARAELLAILAEELSLDAARR